MLGYAFCGSFCTHAAALRELKHLIDAGYEVQPIVSESVKSTDTRFGRAADLCREIERLTGREVIARIVDAEPLGPVVELEALILSPCTGNTLAKLACGITDTPVCMAAKAHLRADRPLIIALSTNDALSGNLKSISVMLEKKSVYFVPMYQDDPVNKPHSLMAEFSMIPESLVLALHGKQTGKLFL